MARQGVGRKCRRKEASADPRRCCEEDPKGRTGWMDATPPREGEREVDVLPRKGEHEVDVPLQGIPNEGKSGRGHEVPRNSEGNTPPRRDPKMGALEI